jgi:integrase
MNVHAALLRGGTFDMNHYESWAKMRGNRSETIRGRLVVLGVYEQQYGSLLDATEESLLAFLDAYTGWTRSTYARHLSSLLTYAVECGLLDKAPRVPKAKAPDPRPKPVKDSELKLLLATAATQRLWCWLLLAAYGGLRAGEIAASGPDHLDGTTLELPYVKGGGSSYVMLPDWVAEEISQCPQWNVTAHQVTQTASAHMLDQGVTPGIHRLRHWHATTLLRQTHDLRLVQRAMRHRSIASTTMYTAVEDDELSRAVQRINRVA